MGTYVIGGEFLGNGDPFASGAAGVVTIPQYTWVTDKQLFGAGLNFPTVNTGGGYGQNGILVADFSVGGSHPVPDDGSTLALLGGALALVGALSPRLRK